MEMVQAFIAESNDNVATVLEEIKKGSTILVLIKDKQRKIEAKEEIPSGHKISIEPIKKGGEIVKYGFPIGKSTEDIDQGHHVHIHNVKEIYELEV